jgi:hypothetical protein
MGECRIIEFHKRRKMTAANGLYYIAKGFECLSFDARTVEREMKAAIRPHVRGDVIFAPRYRTAAPLVFGSST